MKRFTRPALAVVAACVAVVAAQTASSAHYVWATIEKGQARFALLENPGESPNPQFAAYVEKLSPRSGGKTLTLGAPQNGARYASLAAGQQIVTAQSIVGVKERNGKTYLLCYEPKGAAALGVAGQMTKAPAEVLARQSGKNLTVSVRQDGWPVPQSEVWVQWPGAETASSVTTDIRGEAQVPWPAGNRAGFVGVRALVKEAKAGEQGGKRYAQVHHWATLTFPVDDTKDEKPFAQVLRASFANNHEVVGNALFNKTLFDGALTRTQLETHLQQRALVHNEVHRILNRADKGHPVPYGAAQKNVLVLLFGDLIAMGSGWPTEAQARPLTRAFLQEIRDSEARGPYFALGVQHVYYGGITNGGRMIGAKIGETLHFTPSYYKKSDGYPEYLVEVNKITDPDARKEMIRGGQAAYRYIIASSNEDIFAAPKAGLTAAPSSAVKP